MIDLRDLNHFRDRLAEGLLWGWNDDSTDTWGGYFRVPVKTSKRPLTIVASCGDQEGAEGWDHVSVSLPARCPTWEEMDMVKRMFFGLDVVAYQLHVPAADHISFHPYCLHLWRSIDQAMPLPPSHFVGPKSEQAA
jgi:hypothetical protein